VFCNTADAIASPRWHHRTPWFLDLACARAVIRELRGSTHLFGAGTLAWVLMPDHLHWLLSLEGDARLADVLRRFKSRSARVVNGFVACAVIATCPGSSPPWMPTRRGFPKPRGSPKIHDHGVRRLPKFNSGWDNPLKSLHAYSIFTNPHFLELRNQWFHE
ncbi:MAG TPA: hypothetical protein ENI68_01375, partial [Gammaproteobacteria bacterium]|nr:hypothetical protein [Gammaproteobacteria bacterium]